MEVVIGQMRKSWKEVRYFENTGTYPHDFIVNRFNVFDLRFVLDWGDCGLYFYRSYFMPFRGIY